MRSNQGFIGELSFRPNPLICKYAPLALSWTHALIYGVVANNRKCKVQSLTWKRKVVAACWKWDFGMPCTLWQYFAFLFANLLSHFSPPDQTLQLMKLTWICFQIPPLSKPFCKMSLSISLSRETFLETCWKQPQLLHSCVPLFVLLAIGLFWICQCTSILLLINLVKSGQFKLPKFSLYIRKYLKILSMPPHCTKWNLNLFLSLSLSTLRHYLCKLN